MTLRAPRYLLLLALVAMACTEQLQLSDEYLRAHAAAQSLGDRSFEIASTVSAQRIAASADEVLNRVDVVLVELVERNKFTSSHTVLETWHEVKVLRSSRANAARRGTDGCKWPKPSVFGSSDALVVLGGTYTYRGVTGRYTTGESYEVVDGNRYVMLVSDCSAGVFRLADGNRGIFPVASDGATLAPNRSRQRSSVALLFDDLRVVDKVFDFVEGVHASSVAVGR